MPVPLVVAVPALAAGAAYINARGSLFYDTRLIASVLPATVDLAWSSYRGRVNLFYRLEHFATSKASADRPYLLFQDRRYTYAQAYDHVLRYGNWLRTRLGVQKGDTVALNFMNSDQFILLFIGLWSIGAKPAFINHNLSGKSLAHCVSKASTTLMLIDPSVADRVDDNVRRLLPGVRCEVFDGERQAEAAAIDPVRLPDEARGQETTENMAILIYTSGTTGLPKAAIVSWGKLLVAGAFSYRFVGTKTDDIYYTAMPLYHSTAILMGFSHTLCAGATLAIGRKFSASLFWDDVRRHDATIIQYVGETCRYLLAGPPRIDPASGANLDCAHRVRIAFGNGLRPDVWTRFKERFGIDTIVEFYGSTEGNFATYNWCRNAFATGAVGRNGWLYNLLLGSNVGLAVVDNATEAPLRDPDTGLCRRAQTGEPGELLFSLPPHDVKSRFQGYLGDPAATNKKILRNVFRRGDAWFRTGDIVRWEPDGLVYFADRIGDTFRWKSENVATTEVAQVLGTHPNVREANVYGVSLPLHEGRAGCAALVLDVPPSAIAPETLSTLAAHVQRDLPKYARPLFLRLIGAGALQTTGTMKQQKHQLREEGVDPARTGGDDVYWLKDDTYARFRPRDWTNITAGRVRL